MNILLKGLLGPDMSSDLREPIGVVPANLHFFPCLSMVWWRQFEFGNERNPRPPWSVKADGVSERILSKIPSLGIGASPKLASESFNGE